MITACAKPGPLKIPNRIARMKRIAESKRMDTLKKLQESLLEVGEKDKELLKEFTDPKLVLSEDCSEEC